jgi:anti-sigma regulatory factor (Ser/Thr protein kinase)
VNDDTDNRVADLRYHGVASTDRLTSLRHDLTRWSTRAGLTEDYVEAVTLAGYEALANAAEHAYASSMDNPINLHATLDMGRVTVTVTDWGRWREPPADPGVRGRGLLLIRKLCTRAHIAATEDGTTVTMTWDLDSIPTR